MIDPAAREVWGALASKLRPFLARRVRTEADVDDVLQDVFFRLQRGLGALRRDDRFGPWVYQVARSAVADYYRRSARHPLVAADALDEAAAAEPEEDDAEAEVASWVAPFVAMLPSPYREALTLTELEGLTQKQAADMLGVSLSGMKSRVQRGRVQLRKALEDCCTFAWDARGRIVSWEPRRDGKLPESCCADASSESESVCRDGESRARPRQVGNPEAEEQVAQGSAADDDGHADGEHGPRP